MCFAETISNRSKNCNLQILWIHWNNNTSTACYSVITVEWFPAESAVTISRNQKNIRYNTVRNILVNSMEHTGIE